MRIIITLLALGAAVARVDATPARPIRPVADLRLVFLDGDDRAPVRRGAYDDAIIDVGRVVAARCHSRGCMRTAVRRQFRVRVEGATTARFARTHAFLQNDVPGHRVLLDGRPLTAAPVLIDAGVPLGLAVAHTLEIEVPSSEPEGVIADSIVWLVEDVP